MLVTDDQMTQILEDPNQFVSDEDNEFTVKDIKSWCNDFIHEVIDQHKQTKMVLPIVDYFLTANYPKPTQTQTSQNQANSTEF